MVQQLEKLLRARPRNAHAHAAVEKKLLTYRQRIAQGEFSTGDPIRDHLIAISGIYYSYEKELEKELRSLDRNLRAHEGEQTLIVNNRYVKSCISEGCGRIAGGIGNIPYLDKSYLQLGLVAGGLDFRYQWQHNESYQSYRVKGNVIIPSRRTVVWDYEKSSERSTKLPTKWKRKEGPLVIEGTHALVVPKEKREDQKRWDNRSFYFHVFVGNKTVEMYFRLAGEMDDDEIIEQTIKSGDKSRTYSRYDPSYARALRLLGLNVPVTFQRALENRVETDP